MCNLNFSLAFSGTSKVSQVLNIIMLVWFNWRSGQCGLATVCEFYFLNPGQVNIDCKFAQLFVSCFYRCQAGGVGPCLSSPGREGTGRMRLHT